MDLFDGQPMGIPDYSVIDMGSMGGLFTGLEQTELGAANPLLLSDERLRANTRAVQARGDIDVADVEAQLDAWTLIDARANRQRRCPHFSVEMETGTGKTYVYLRTIFELSQRYGFQKFIIVVPSVAIREGVLKNIEITADHFRALYNNMPFEHFVYDAQEREPPASVCYQQHPPDSHHQHRRLPQELHGYRSRAKEQRHLQGERQALRAAADRVRPGRSADRHHRRAAERRLARRNPRRQSRRLIRFAPCGIRRRTAIRTTWCIGSIPVRAFELRLVKQIVVASAVAAGGAQRRLRSGRRDRHTETESRRSCEFMCRPPDGPKEKVVTVKNETDLFVRFQGARRVRPGLFGRRDQCGARE